MRMSHGFFLMPIEMWRAVAINSKHDRASEGVHVLHGDVDGRRQGRIGDIDNFRVDADREDRRAQRRDSKHVQLS